MVIPTDVTLSYCIIKCATIWKIYIMLIFQMANCSWRTARRMNEWATQRMQQNHGIYHTHMPFCTSVFKKLPLLNLGVLPKSSCNLLLTYIAISFFFTYGSTKGWNSFSCSFNKTTFMCSMVKICHFLSQKQPYNDSGHSYCLGYTCFKFLSH